MHHKLAFGHKLLVSGMSHKLKLAVVSSNFHKLVLVHKQAWHRKRRALLHKLAVAFDIHHNLAGGLRSLGVEAQHHNRFEDLEAWG